MATPDWLHAQNHEKAYCMYLACSCRGLWQEPSWKGKPSKVGVWIRRVIRCVYKFKNSRFIKINSIAIMCLYSFENNMS